MATRAYTSPGVSVAETISPALAPLIAGPSVIAIVGAAAGQETASERLILEGTGTSASSWLPAANPVTLRYTGVDDASVVVRSAVTGEVLNEGNYALTAGTDPDATVTGDEPWTLALRYSPSAAPQVANSGTGTLSGTYKYAYSFLNADGETGLSPESLPTTFAAQGANLTGIAVGPTGTLSRNVYRAKVVGGVTGTYHLVSTIANNTATTLSNESTIDATADAAATPKTGIANGDTVIVTYDYTSNRYFEPTYFTDYDDIVDKYGEPFDSAGNISSKLSFAARLAFQNGASEIVAVAAETDNDQGISDAFERLEEDPAVRVVVAASGSTAVHTALAAHVTAMNTQGFYRQAIIGRDGSTVAIQPETLREAAKAFNSEAVIMVSPASFIMQNPITGRNMFVGGQYAAAGVAGMFAARDVQVSLTRKTLAGFLGLGDRRTATQQSIDSQAGLFVFLDRGGVLQVRHQVTTAVKNSNTAEASVVRAKYEMAHRLRDTLDGAVVGQVIPHAEVPIVVAGIVSGVLEELLIEGAIHGYGQTKARILATDATTVEVRFEYRPAFPINNVVVRFTINTQTGDFEVA